MPTLFEIGQDLAGLEAAIDRIAEAPQELQQELEQVFEQMKTATEAGLKVKLDNYCNLILQLKSYQEIRRREAARLNTLAAADAAAVINLETRLQQFMATIGVKKIKSNFHELSVVRNGGLAPLVYEEVDPLELPPELQKVTIQLNKTALREQLEDGVEFTWARIGERGYSLRMK
jgi:hypothetical protein